MSNRKQWDMKRKLVEMRKFERVVPKLVANAMEKHVLDNFDNESFSDTAINSDPWEKRKSSTKRDRATGKRRGILVQSGALRGSIKVKSATMKKIAVGSYGLKYATYHNNGTSKLPQRKFVGESRILTKKIKRIIDKQLKRIL